MPNKTKFSGTPIDLNRHIKLNKSSHHRCYELQEIGEPTLADLLLKIFGRKK